MTHSNLSRTHQSGVVLFTSLIMLLLLTLVGITSVGTTILEEKMSGNLRDTNLAFQSAEIALRTGEALIDVPTRTLADFNNTNGLYSQAADTETSFADGSIWTGSNSKEHTSDVPISATKNLPSKPRYYIQIISTRTETNIAGFCYAIGVNTGPCTYTVFKVVAKGTGAANTSQVFLQSYYERAF